MIYGRMPGVRGVSDESHRAYLKWMERFAPKEKAPMSTDLDNAAEEAAEDICRRESSPALTSEHLKEAFKLGVEWAIEQHAKTIAKGLRNAIMESDRAGYDSDDYPKEPCGC